MTSAYSINSNTQKLRGKEKENLPFDFSVCQQQQQQFRSQHLTDLWVKGNWHCRSLLEASA